MKKKDLILTIIAIALGVTIALLTSCSDVLCPAYASNHTHTTRR